MSCERDGALPWASHRITLVYPQRRIVCRHCGIRAERIEFADPKARVTRRLRQHIGLDCQSMPTSHAAVRHGEVLGLAKDRSADSLTGLLTTCLDARQRAAVEAVCTDMRQLYLNAVSNRLKQAEIVFDRFHVLQHASGVSFANIPTVPRIVDGGVLHIRDEGTSARRDVDDVSGHGLPIAMECADRIVSGRS